MDFVVGGVGLGALAVLLGLALRDGGAWWTRLRRSSAAGREYAAALDAVCRTAGRLLALGGGLLLLVTLLALLGGASDGVGAATVAVGTAAVAVALTAWLVRSTRHQIRPLAAWPTHPSPAPESDDPPSLAVASARGPAETGGTAETRPGVPSAAVGDDDPLQDEAVRSEADATAAIEAPNAVAEPGPEPSPGAAAIPVDADHGTVAEPAAAGESPRPAAGEIDVDDVAPRSDPADLDAARGDRCDPEVEAGVVALDPSLGDGGTEEDDVPVPTAGADRLHQRVETP